ncbi:MAG: hypothetical protein WBI07_15350 [Mobilitalea sp.]
MFLFTFVCIGVLGSSFDMFTEGTQNIIITVMGSVLALVGSVALQLANEKSKVRKQEQRNLMLLKKELTNNFMVCLYRIENDDSEIPFFDEIYNQFLIGENWFDRKHTNKTGNEILSDFYFLIQRGNYGLLLFKDFYHKVFKKQKKTVQNNIEMRSIIDAMGIEKIYEFSIMKQIIIIDKLLDLNLDLPFYDFCRILEYNEISVKNHQEATAIYLTDVLCKKYFDQPTKYFIEKEEDRRCS